MKNFTLVLALFLPFLTIAQEPLPQIRKKATTETVFGKNHMVQSLKKMEELKKEFSLNSISQKIKQLQAEEEGLKNSFREIFPGGEIIEKLRENNLKSAQSDSMRNDSLYIYAFKSPTDSLLMGKIYGTYNAKGNFGHVWRLELDTLTMQWRNNSKDDYFYDENDMNTSFFHNVWDTVENDWLPGYKKEMEYDSNGKSTMLAYFDWNNNLKKWLGRTKYEYAWDEWGNRILYAGYNWDETTGAWTGYDKFETAYNEVGKEILYIYYQWNYSLNNWQGYSKVELTYDDMVVYITLTIHSVWDEIYGDWIFQRKYESVFGQDGSTQTANYWWDQSNEKWIGQYKYTNYIISQTEQYSIFYSWNRMKDTWEESGKSVSNLNDGLSHQFTTYIKQDSIIPGIVINGFNTEDDINTISTNLWCPEQTCSVLDSDFVEGTASIRWDYHTSGKINNNRGACQFELLNSTDMTGFDGISMNYKVLEPSFAYFVLILIESDEEVWEYTNYELPRDTSVFWKVVTVPFNNVYPRNYVDGQLNLKNIKKIIIQAFSDSATEISGTILLDNLTACNIAKSKLWIPESFTEEIFDENYNFITSTQFRWDSYLQEFIATSKNKNELGYDENGNIISKNSYEWHEHMDSLDWNNSGKEESEYDEYGNQTRLESYYWNGEWIGSYKFQKSYDENGNILTFVDYHWQYEKKEWIPAYREENTFIADSIQTSNAIWNWDLNLNKLIGSSKHETVFNEALEKIKEINYEWDINTGTWKILNIDIVKHYEYQYDSEERLQAYVIEIWNEILNEWMPLNKYIYYWSMHSIATEITEIFNQNQLVEVYPNPATDYICVKTSSGFKNGTINITNSSGQKVKTLTTVGDVTNINVTDLPAGNYILQFATDKNVCVKKIIIR